MNVTNIEFGENFVTISPVNNGHGHVESPAPDPSTLPQIPYPGVSTVTNETGVFHSDHPATVQLAPAYTTSSTVYEEGSQQPPSTELTAIGVAFMSTAMVAAVVKRRFLS